MTTTANSPAEPAALDPVKGPMSADLRRLHGAAIVRIAFGIIWAIDAIFKFLPGFISGDTLEDELGGAAKVQTPIIHQWLELWHSIGTANPAATAITIGVIEVLIAAGLILGAFSNVVFIGSAVFSFGIWSTAEAFHLPWTRTGITDLGASAGYIIASLALFFAAAGATWSLDTKIRPMLGRRAWLSSPLP